MSSSNQAAWLSAKGSKLSVGPAEMPSPGPDELLIENSAVATNPVDWKQQASGIFIQSFPTILGCDAAGTVVKVGSNVTSFKAGDRVLAHCIGIKTQKDTDEAFQKFTCVPAELAAVIPENMPFSEAAVIPLGLSTAAAGLYEKQNLGLPLPSTSPNKTGKTILLWGGSSSVGSCAIQLAVASGVDVVSISSSSNFDYCKALGAKAVFDYRSPSIVGDLVAELGKGDFAGAYDAIGSSTLQIIDVVAQLGGGHVATALSVPDTGLIPATVTCTRIFGIPMGNGNTVGQSVYHDFLPVALKSGQFKALPPAKVVGKGLEAIQTAMDQLKAGVSASKLVVTL